MVHGMHLHDFFLTAGAQCHHSDMGTVCRAALTEAEGAMLDVARRALVGQAVQRCTAQARMEERHTVCEARLKSVHASASDSEITNSLVELIASLHKP